ncbi:tRNA (adenosine(37)-N6)-dimethylallyltransferase MiaA [Cognatitamlana onchidii]|uniref:tRNA (adenosine(37)-N6)-dimethylallyltransferase MiaA n=1 Tax=Cognatitamlana onchidii TaxID=2562860 RepID=UPI0010A652F8|nr:tRNA (adenosine(37)-N6)-dimethylallyltransferase MiaA [Algibacter onchidii]
MQSFFQFNFAYNKTPGAIETQTKYLISVIGPTAIGKTALSIELAKHFNTDIISADSRQFFKEMQIGTAAPTSEELSQAKHHFIHNKSIKEHYSVGSFEKEALHCLENLFQTKDIVIMVGGSGLYVDAVTKGLDTFPDVDSSIRNQLNTDLETKGLEYLQQQLKKLDPQSFRTIAIDNPHRVIRALEICLGTRQPFSSFLNKEKRVRPFKTITIGLTAERELIYNRINQRVDIMIKQGLIDEAKTLLPYKELNALNTVGYKEIFNALEGHTEIDVAISEIKKNTRRFAKRQLTWFKKNTAAYWFDYNTPISFIIEKIESIIRFKSNEFVLDNPVWFALTEKQQDPCLKLNKLKFYAPEYAPFGAFIGPQDSTAAIESYSKLIDTFYIVGNKPKVPAHFKEPVKYIGLQMINYNKINHPITTNIVELKSNHHKDLIDLVNMVYPDFFKPKTFLLGRYYGIYRNNKLVAAAGERMQTQNFTEISAVVTHPKHVGKGFAKQLITHATNEIFRNNKIPFLHVDETNLGPIQLYKKLGFSVRRKMAYWKVDAK